MNSPTAKKKRHSVPVYEPTHQKLENLKAESGVSITRLIDQAVDGLVIARRKRRKPLA